MAFPKDQVELNERGYRFHGHGRCSKCEAKIAWYFTPANRLMPLRADTLVPHFADCPFSKQFQKKKGEKPSWPKLF